MIPWRRKWQTVSVFLPGKFHGQKSLAGFCPWVTKSQHDLVTENSNNSFREFSNFREAESLEDLLKYVLLGLTYSIWSEASEFAFL